MSDTENSPEQRPQTETRQSRVDVIKKDAISMVKNDLLGVADWKRSKIGAVTGFTSAKRSIAAVGTTLADTSDRLSGLYGSLTAIDPAPSLEDGDGSPEERFARSMELHGKNERDIAIMVRNTCWTAWLYAGLSGVYLGAIIFWFIMAPASDPFMVMLRIGILPFILALLFKHSYANWIARKRTLASPLVFLKSGDLLPRSAKR